MGPKEVVAGATDVSVVIRIMDSTDGTPETGVEHNTSGIDLNYQRQGAAVTSITEAALTALTDAHSDGGIEHIGNGRYRLDIPDAAFAFGADYVDIGGTVTGMVVYGPTIRLLDPINGLFASQTVGATGNDMTHFHAPSWTYGDDEINGYVAVVYDDSDAEYFVVRITDWVNSTKLATFTPALPASVEASTDLVALLGKLDDRTGDILTDTAEIGAAGAGLTEAGGTGDHLTALATQASVDTIDGIVDSILTDTGTTLDTKIDTIDTIVDAIKAKTDSLTFTKAGEVDANAQSINGATLTGDGSATPFDVV